jgi:hypothetical protein
MDAGAELADHLEMANASAAPGRLDLRGLQDPVQLDPRLPAVLHPIPAR